MKNLMNSRLKIIGTNLANSRMCGRYTLTNKIEVKRKFEIDIEDVFVAKTVFLLQILSSSLNKLDFNSNFSGIASIIRSKSLHIFKSVVVCILFKI